MTQVRPLDTTTSNQFEFASANYSASRGATGAVITVRFSPGNRSWSGSVNYRTADGTALSNQDYVAASGTLYFSGNAYGSFTVPLMSGQSNPQKTILLALSPSPSDPNAILLRSNAVLTINFPPPPDVRITQGQNGTVVICWSDDGTDLVLEKLTPPSPNWTFLSTGFAEGSTRSCNDVACDGVAFYRLRRSQ